MGGHWYVHEEYIANCTYCGMPKGTSQAKLMSNREKIKPIVFAVEP